MSGRLRRIASTDRPSSSAHSVRAHIHVEVGIVQDVVFGTEGRAESTARAFVNPAQERRIARRLIPARERDAPAVAKHEAR
jgi:hypothetical protein